MKTAIMMATMWLTAILACGSASAAPTAQVMIPSTDVKGLQEVAIGYTYLGRFSPKANAGASSSDIGLTTGLLPFDNLKMEAGIDYLTSNLQNDNTADNHPVYFNAKLGTPEDAFGIKGLPAFALGAFNLGTDDTPQKGISTRQNIVYALAAKSLPVVGRLSAGGYHGSERALGKGGNEGVLLSWDRTMTELSDKLWLGADFMGGNNANGEASFGASWNFTKQVTVLLGGVFFNPLYRPSGPGDLPGGKPAYTLQLTVNLP